MHSVRYAHSEGYTEICYAQDKGQQFITSGEDGEIRIWQGFDDVDNRSIQVGEKCCALAYGDGKIYVADDQNEVKRYDLESGELLGVVTSFNMQVTCMCLNKSSTQLACGSANFEVHLVDLSSLKSTKFSGHEAPILSLCFDPFQKYFISASCDSSARIWSVANLNTVKTLNSLHAKSNDFVDSESWCKIAWHKDGGLFAVPNKKDVDFYERESWILKFKINLKNENNPSEEFVASILSFSPDGKHILAVTSTQMVFVHSIINKSLVYKYSYNKKSRMCSLVWHDINEVLFCDIKGQMGQIKPSLNGDKNNGESVAVVKEALAKKKGDDLEMDDLIGLLEDDDESSKQSSDSGVGKVKKAKAKSGTDKSDKSMKSPKKKRMRTNDDGDEIEGTDESSRDSDDRVVAKSAKNKLSSDDEVEEVNELLDEAEEDDEMIGDDDEECDSMEKLKLRAYKLAKKEALLATAASELKETDQDNQLATKKPSTSYVESIQQKPFQPSSTPVSLNERYMVWNSVGVITQFNRDTDDSIDIEFHNASHHHTMHIKNQLGYTMADVSREAVVLASPGQQTDEASDDLNEVLAQAVTSTSKLTCIMLQSLDSAASREWQVDMPKREYIRCVSASRVLVACATSRKFLRVFYLSGVQRELICLNGLPVALAAYDHKIFVAYIANNRLEYSIYNLNPERKPTDEAESGVLPISGGSDVQLAWLGFSEEGNPYCYDSSGYLYGRFSRALWSPISSLRATLSHKSDNYWLVGISERTQMVKAVLCRASKYPNVLPRPNISVIAMHMPLCDPDSEKTKLEQDYWKNALLANNIKSYEWQSNNVEDLEEDELAEKVESYEGAAREALMKLFMLACKAGKEQRAFDVATIMDVDAIQLAIKFATKSRALSLAHKLNDLAERKLRLEQQNKALESQYDTYYQGSSRMDSTHHHANHINHNTTQDTSEIIIEGSTLPTQTNHTTASNKPSNDSINFESQVTIDDSMTSMSKTPTIMPSTATRINPFASKSAMKTPLMMSNETQNDDNTTPKYSVLKDIEDKVNKRNAQSNAKDKDVWKPTPNRKLVKNKVSENNTPTIGSFFNK